MELRAAIQHTRELAAALGPRRLDAIADALRPGVTEWRWADGFSVPHRPEPYLAIRDSRDGGWRDAPDDETPAFRVGLDGAGRVLVVERDAWGERGVAEAWEHHEGELRVFEHDRGQLTARVLYGSPVTTVVWATDGGREFGIERWHRPPDAPMRGEVAEVQVDGWVIARAYEIHLDDGELDLIATGTVDTVIEEATRIPADAVVDALLTQLEEAERIDCGEPLWEARLHRPEPDLRPSPALVDALTTGLAAAIDRAVASAGIDRPFVLEHRPTPDPDPQLPGFLRIGSARFRDEMRRFGSGDRDALHLLWKGEDTGEVARIELADHCDAETLRACREVNTALSHLRDFDDPQQQRARQALGALGARLTAELNRAGRFHGTADPFLALVEVGDPYGDTDAITRARRALGPERVERFLASLTSEVAASAQVTGDHVHAARRDRGALALWLRERGLDPDLAGVAVRSLRLLPAPHAGTRIGGRGLLPSGMEWPRTTEGRPLSFLAGLDLAELPTGGVLPDQGWLLFFADLDDEGEALGFIGEPTPNDPGADAQVLAAPQVADAEPPADLAHEPHVRIPERRVAPQPQLTLPDGYDAGEQLGLDPARAAAYDDIAAALRFGTEGDDPGPDDWVLGAVTGAQGQEPEEGTALLLHLGTIEFMDAGTIQFRIPDAALADRDWSQVVAEGDSC